MSRPVAGSNPWKVIVAPGDTVPERRVGDAVAVPVMLTLIPTVGPPGSPAAASAAPDWEAPVHNSCVRCHLFFHFLGHPEPTISKLQNCRVLRSGKLDLGARPSKSRGNPSDQAALLLVETIASGVSRPQAEAIRASTIV